MCGKKSKLSPTSSPCTITVSICTASLHSLLLITPIIIIMIRKMIYLYTQMHLWKGIEQYKQTIRNLTERKHTVTPDTVLLAPLVCHPLIFIILWLWSCVDLITYCLLIIYLFAEFQHWFVGGTQVWQTVVDYTHHHLSSLSILLALTRCYHSLHSQKTFDCRDLLSGWGWGWGCVQAAHASNL